MGRSKRNRRKAENAQAEEQQLTGQTGPVTAQMPAGVANGKAKKQRPQTAVIDQPKGLQPTGNTQQSRPKAALVPQINMKDVI